MQECMQNGLEIGGIMGTSAGALSGSLYAAGYTPEQVSTTNRSLLPLCEIVLLVIDPARLSVHP
jgi:predicted acylesterase/phospholipase RssA